MSSASTTRRGLMSTPPCFWANATKSPSWMLRVSSISRGITTWRRWLTRPIRSLAVVDFIPMPLHIIRLSEYVKHSWRGHSYLSHRDPSRYPRRRTRLGNRRFSSWQAEQNNSAERHQASRDPLRERESPHQRLLVKTEELDDKTDHAVENQIETNHNSRS